MLKKLTILITILLIFSCKITFHESDDKPDYVGTWTRVIDTSSTTSTSIRLEMDEDDYRVFQDTLIILTGDTSSTEVEKGEITNSTSSQFVITQTHILEGSTLVYIPVTFQESHASIWTESGSRLTITGSGSSYIDGTFTKD